MCIAIIGDVHLGASHNLGTTHQDENINTRLIDYTNTLFNTIDDIADVGINTIIFTGDIFEHRKPTIFQQKIFSKALFHATERGIDNIHIVIGNHDQQRLKSATTLSYLKELNLPHIKIHDDIESAYLTDSNNIIVANLLFLPYRDRKWYGVETHEDAVACVNREVSFTVKSIDNDKPKILIGHMTVDGTFIHDSYNDMYSENQLFLPKDIFADIDMTILGHIHTPGVISNNPYIAYVGSMEKRSGFEDHDKVYAIIDTTSLKVDFHKEPCREIFDLNIDLSNNIYEKKAFDVICKEIDAFAQTHNLNGSIIKIQLRILIEDEQYCDCKKIQAYLYSQHSVYNCLEIVPTFFSARQSRDDRITERISDAEALKIFINNTADSEELKADLLSTGFEIMKTLVEVDDASYQD